MKDNKDDKIFKIAATVSGIILIICFFMVVSQPRDCNADTNHQQAKITMVTDDKNFQVIKTGTGYQIVYDKETGVMYIHCSNKWSQNFTPMLDANGKPRIADDFKKNKQ